MHIKIILLFIITAISGCALQQPSHSKVETDIISNIETLEEINSLDVKIAEAEKIEQVLIPSVPNTIWPRLTTPFNLVAQNDHKSLANHIKWFANNQRYINRISGRGSLYLFFILDEIEKRGMPHELALLPAIESAYNPRAYSHSHAAGLWQFIPMTGDRFGLERTWWKDDRRDVVASTNAALDYLQYLHKYFDGDWLLAIAAYNCGEGTLRKAINRNKKRGKPTDFWSLKLPKETQNYVPKLLALATVIESPESYGVALQRIPDAPYFDVVTLPKSINLSIAARMAKIDYKLIQALNPALKRKVTAPGGPHKILLPIESSETFKAILATTPVSDWSPNEQYIVKPGDSLSKIAQTYHLRIKELSQHNRLSSNVLQIGQRLEIPGTGVATSSQNQSATIYTVKKGDSLWSIAKKQGTSVKELAKWNSISANTLLKPGQRLHVKTANPASIEHVKKLTYRVRRGDSLSRIASKFYLSIADILNWNQLSKKAYLQPGQQLTLFVDLNKI